MVTIREIRDKILSGELALPALVDSYLTRIQENKDLNAFLEVYTDEARSKALEIDQKIKNGQAGRLAGLVIGLKDNICFKGHKVSASSKILEGFESLYSATVVEKLLAEDAIIIGRLNCDEFAMGSSNEKSAFGPVRNPYDKERVPGGSSGGSAAAVAANLCHAALGSDTGGSIRQPASFCGIVGFKPTYGRVSRYGLLAYASSFDQIGPFTRNVEDSAIITEVISGKDHKDSTSSSVPVNSFMTENEASKKRFAYIQECIEHAGISSEIKKSFYEFLDELKRNGHQVERVSFPYLDYMVPAYYVLTTAEASSNLSRYAGILYGYRSKSAKDIDSAFRKSRSEGFGLEVKRRIMLGTFVLSAGYYDAYYAKAQKVRRLLTEKTSEILKDFDFILTPTTPKTAFKIGEVSDPVSMYLEDIFTVHANLTGLPTLSMPLGFDSQKLPYSIQLMGPKFSEKDIFSTGQMLERTLNSFKFVEK